MITVISFLFFYLLIYFLGRSLTLLLKIKLKKLYEIPINIMYPIIGFFYISNITLITNFFFKINSQFSALLLIIPLFFNFFLFEINKLKISIKNLSLYIFTPLVLGISSSNINLAYDAGLYHLNHQKWLQADKIIFGLSNNHNRFGYSSIIEYLNVNFWLNDNFILLHFTNLIFIVVFFQIIYILLFSKHFKFAISILIYGFLDNFGFNGGKNGFIEVESIAKQDSPFAVIFIISTYVLYKLYLDKSIIPKEKLLMIFLLTIFSVELRLLGFINVVFFFIVLIYKYKFRKSLLIIFKDNFLISLFGISFVIKNLITSSCMFYPVKITCFDFLPWSTGNYSSPGAENDALVDFHIAMTSENYSYWFREWMTKEVNNTVFKNASITFLILLFYLLFHRFKNNEKYNPASIFLLGYCIFSLIILIVTSPSIRFAVGIILSFVFYLSVVFESKTIKTRKYKVLLPTIFYFISLGLVPQTNNYFSLIENFSDTELRNIEVPEIEYSVNNIGYGVIPKSGDQCWINLECVRNKNVTKGDYYTYIIFKK